MDATLVKNLFDVGFAAVMFFIWWITKKAADEKDIRIKDMTDKLIEKYDKNTEAMTKFNATVETSIKSADRTSEMIGEINNILLSKK